MSARCLSLLLVLGCNPLEEPVDEDSDVEDPDARPTFGRLYDTPMSVVWGWNQQEAPGACVDLEIATNGARVEDWKLRITLDRELELLDYVTGADIQVEGDLLTILPSVSAQLGAEEQVRASFCSEPGVRLLAMAAEVTYYVEPVLPDPADELPLPYETMYGAEGTYAVEYAQDGVVNGGVCLRVHVINLIDEPLLDWAIELTMDGETAPTYTEGLRFYSAASDVLIVLPDADSRRIQPFDDEVGRVCLEPLALPIGTRIGAAPEL
jgi:hypothetical protein